MALSIKPCPQCGVAVVPMSDGTCPACRARSFPPSRDVAASGPESVAASRGDAQEEPRRQIPSQSRPLSSTTGTLAGENQQAFWVLSSLGYLICAFIVGMGCALTHWDWEGVLGVFCMVLWPWFGISLFLDPGSYAATATRCFYLAAVPTLGMIAGFGVASLKADSPHLSPPELLAAVVVLPLIAGAVAVLVSAAVVAVSRAILQPAGNRRSRSLACDGLFRLCWGATAALAPLTCLAIVTVRHRMLQESLIQPSGSGLGEYVLLADQLNEQARRVGVVDALAVGLLLLAVVLITVVGMRARMRLRANNATNDARG